MAISIINKPLKLGWANPALLIKEFAHRNNLDAQVHTNDSTTIYFVIPHHDAAQLPELLGEYIIGGQQVHCFASIGCLACALTLSSVATTAASVLTLSTVGSASTAQFVERDSS